MTFQHRRRRKANVWTDARANLILEVLGGMRIVKYFSYEIPFVKRKNEPNMFVGALLSFLFFRLGIFDIRKKEMDGIKGIQLVQAAKSVTRSFSIRSPRFLTKRFWSTSTALRCLTQFLS